MLQQRFYAGVVQARHDAALQRFYAGVQHAQYEAATARGSTPASSKSAPVVVAQQATTAAPSGPASNLNWSALAACESSGNPPGGQLRWIHGLYQFDQRTWESVGGTGSPLNASSAEQTLRAEILYSQRGSSPWPVCGSRLYS